MMKKNDRAYKSLCYILTFSEETALQPSFQKSKKFGSSDLLSLNFFNLPPFLSNFFSIVSLLPCFHSYSLYLKIEIELIAAVWCLKQNKATRDNLEKSSWEITLYEEAILELRK